jgi:hypothetical protein
VYTICAEVNVVPPNPDSLRFHLRNNFKIVKKAFKHEEGYVVDFLVKELVQPATRQNKKQELVDEPVNQKQNKKLVEAEEVELRCEDCKKDFNSEYNLHIHLESEGHRTRVAAIKRLYLEPKPEK